MDDNGIPIFFKTFPGNTLDHHTLRPAMTETVDEFGLGRFRKNGEVLDGTKLVAMIDDDKLNEFNELMGYFSRPRGPCSESDLSRQLFGILSPVGRSEIFIIQVRPELWIFAESDP